MKKLALFVVCVAACAIAKADTVVIRQPGLIEGLGQAVVGVTRCVGEAAVGLVAGSTTVINTPNYYAQPVAVAPAPVAVAPQPVAVAPAQPVVIAPNPVTCAPTVYPCRSGYGPRYIRARRGWDPRFGGGYYRTQIYQGAGPVYGPCY